MQKNHRARNARTTSSIVVLLLMLSSCLFFPGTTQSAKAVDVSKACAFPSAKNETAYAAPDGIGQTISGDGNYWPDIYHRYGGTWGIITNDFNDSTYLNAPTNPNITGTQALDNATITGVWLVATFPYAAPPMDFLIHMSSLRISYRYYEPLLPAWINQGPFTPSFMVFYGAGVPWGMAADVTDWVPVGSSWTAAMLRSSTLSIQFSCTVDNGYVFFMDYLGLYYTYTQPGAGGGTGPGGPSDGSGPGFNFPSFGGSWLVTILAISMGTVGLIGMIAYPAAAIKNHKRGSNPSESLVGALTLEFIFIGMLYAALMIA